jgi:hypothetical protein
MSFGGGGGGQNTNTIQQSEPYAPAQPALNQIISEAGAIYGAGPAAAGFVAPSTQTLQGLATQETMANAANQQIMDLQVWVRSQQLLVRLQKKHYLMHFNN